MKFKILIIFVFPALFFSCMTPPKNIIYFQDLELYEQNLRMQNNLETYEPIIKKFDELMITVSAPTLNQINVAQFNPPLTSFLSPSDENIVQQSISVQTYTVNHDGSIIFPVIGQIPLAGLKKSQAIEKIKKLVSVYLEDAMVSMKIMSFQVTVLGEVLNPGPIPVNKDKISILDAIGAAGDLTIFANRQNVLLIRENDYGPNDYIRFDLTKSEIFASPYFYLQQNDVIVVEQNKTRQSDSKYGSADGYKISVLSMVFSAFSILTSTLITIITVTR